MLVKELKRNTDEVQAYQVGDRVIEIQPLETTDQSEAMAALMNDAHSNHLPNDTLGQRLKALSSNQCLKASVYEEGCFEDTTPTQACFIYDEESLNKFWAGQILEEAMVYAFSHLQQLKMSIQEPMELIVEIETILAKTVRHVCEVVSGFGLNSAMIKSMISVHDAWSTFDETLREASEESDTGLKP